VEIKCQLDATEVFIADLITCSTCFGHHYAHHKELKSIILWLLPVVFGAVFFKLLFWCGVRVNNSKELFCCDFDHASSLICGNKMPTRCNRGFYCRSYCLLNMFQAPLCPSSGAQEYYTVVAACGISCCGFQVSCILQTGHITLSSTTDQQLENDSTKYHRQRPLYDILELLIMGIVVSETC